MPANVNLQRKAGRGGVAHEEGEEPEGGRGGETVVLRGALR